jgi:hypothetical protein
MTTAPLYPFPKTRAFVFAFRQLPRSSINDIECLPVLSSRRYCEYDDDKDNPRGQSTPNLALLALFLWSPKGEYDHDEYLRRVSSTKDSTRLPDSTP